MSANSQNINAHWERAGLNQEILDALKAAGKQLDALTIDDLAPLDQFHGGGKTFTNRLANLANLKSGLKVLDVGGGLGGPARTLAVDYGCHVTVLDLTDSYIQAGAMLTKLLHLENQVSHQVGNALELPFEDNSFDAVWTQNSGMNIEDKEKLYAEIYRVLRAGGVFATQEPMSGGNEPPHFPVMWSRDGNGNYLRTPQEMRTLIKYAGFQTRKWDDVTKEKSAPSPTTLRSIQSIVMGDDLLAKIRATDKPNTEENRIVMIQAVFSKV